MTLRATATVLRAAWRRPAWVELLAVAGALVGLTVATLSRNQAPTFQAGVVGSLIVLVLAMHLVQGVVRQNHPHLARLMPGHRASLQSALRAILLAGVGASAALWVGLVPAERPVMLFLLPLVLWIIVCIGMGRQVLSMLLPVLGVGALLAAREVGLAKTTALWVAIGVSDALMVLVLPLLLRRGDAAHAEHWRRLRNTEAVMNTSLEGGKLGAYQGNSLMARLLGWWLWPTRRLMNDARDPVRSGDDALRRAMWVVNPGLHLLQQVWMLLSVGGVVAAGAVLPAVLGASRHAAGPAIAQGIGLGVMMWFYLLTVGGSLAEHWSTRSEQALLRLTPQVPQGPALQRGWGQVLRRHAVGGWLLHSALAWALCAALAPAAWPHALAATLVVAPAAWLLPRKAWARQQPPRGSWMALVTLWTALSVAVLLVPLLGGPTLWAVPVAAWALAAALVLAARRHPTLTPWPAGHAGT